MSLKESSKTIYDGFTTIKRGIDSGTAPSAIGADQVSFAINTTFRGGYPHNRPGLSKIPLTGDNFQLGRWQGAHPFIGTDQKPSIIASIGGQIIRFDPISNQTTNLSTSSGLSNPSNLPQTWMCQALNFLPIQDASSIPLVWDGATLRRGNPRAFGGNEFPVGSIMTYNNGRLWVATPDRTGFTGGDLAYSVTGAPDDVLSDIDNKFINAGGIFTLSSDAGIITAMRSIALQDSTLGQGPLQVFAQKGTSSINAPFDRTAWFDVDSALVSSSLLSTGPTSQYGTININGDLWYRSDDGVRSFMIARRDHGSWVNTPVSDEMERVIIRDDPYLLGFVSSVDFDNRLLVTVSPYRATYDAVEYGVAFRGLAVLDFKPTNGMFNRANPYWEGIWTGLQILQVITVNCYGLDRCFIFALNASHQIEMWELSRNNRFDNLSDPISWTIETGSIKFKDQGELLKRLERTERWFDKVYGSLTYDFSFKPDAFWDWISLDSGSVCSTASNCTPPGCTVPSFPREQYRPRQLSAAPDDTCETCVNKPAKNAFEYQFKLAMDGAGQLRRFRAVATDLPENTTGGCFSEETCCEETGCEYNPWAYSTPD